MASSKRSSKSQRASSSSISETSLLSLERRKRNNLIIRGLLVVSIIVFLFLTFDYLRSLMVLLFFIVLNAAVALIKRRLPTTIWRYTYGFELVLLCTVVSSIALGSKVGMIMGILLMLVNYIAERRPSDYFLVTLSLYAAIGYYAYYFRYLGVINLGIIVAMIYNAFAFLLSKFFGGKTSSLIIFNIINILFNIAMFSLYGEFFLGLL